MFAHECAPYHRSESTAGAQRPAQFAKWLPEFGWRAVVLCCNATRRRAVGPEAVAAAVEDARRTLRSAGTGSVLVPTPSLRWDGVVDRAWIALRDRRSRVARVARKVLTAASLARGDASRSWQPVARAVAQAVAGETPIHAALGEHSPDAGLFLGRWFSDTYGAPWIADFRDPFARSLRPAARRAYALVVGRIVRTAAFTLAVTPRWARDDEACFRRPSVLLPNGFDPEEFRSPSPRVDPRLAVGYMGQVIPSQRLEVFLDGLATVASEGLREHLVFRYRGVSQEWVRHLCAARGLAETIDAAPPVPRDQALALMCGSDVLLLLSAAASEDVDPGTSEGLYPAKAFEYIGARRPILCVPGDGGLLDGLLAETRTGRVCETSEAVAAYLRTAVRLHRAGQPQEYAPNVERVERYSRRSQAQRLAALLDAAVGEPGAGAP